MSRNFLDMAGGADFFDVAEALKEHPQDADLRSDDGYDTTALHQAVFEDHAEVAELLLDQGIDIDAVDDQGATALMWAANMGSIDSVRLLLGRGADWRIRDIKGKTALDLARQGAAGEGLGNAESRCQAIADLIEQKIAGDAGPPPGKKPGPPRKALDITIAAAKGHAGELRNILAEHPESVLWAEPITGATALRNVVAYGELPPEDAQLLIDKGADINAKDKGGMTPLMWAAGGGDGAKYLDTILAARPDPHLVNNDGETALDIARKSKDPRFAAKIEKYLQDEWVRQQAAAISRGTSAAVAVKKPLAFRRSGP
jgi:ankyrin repeat protein